MRIDFLVNLFSFVFCLAFFFLYSHQVYYSYNKKFFNKIYITLEIKIYKTK